jgi:DNA-binding SARP family transcriptional activator
MEFGLLGPLMVRRGGTVVPVRPGNQRALLAALLVEANQVVAMDTIAETLWGAEVPPSAVATIRNYVKRLRAALGEAGWDRISTQPGGYLIRVGAGELDAARFEALLDSARAAARGGRWDQVAAHARAAAGLWRGQPLADVQSEILTAREVPRLGELRLQAVELRIEASLHLGGHTEVAGELQRLAAAHPLREHLHELLMLALYRCGRQGEALAAYQRARQVLAGELGIDPGPTLQTLHQQILTADPTLAAPPPAAPTTAPPAADSPAADATAETAAPGKPAAVPARQLPGSAAHFTGRAGELAELTGLLDQAAGRAPGTVVISAIGGTAGVGKTALAVRWAHQVAHLFPGGQLYVNLRGFDPSGDPVTPEQAIRGFLEGLGVPPERIPPGLEAQAGLYRSLLAGQQMLILLDNARDEQQVRALLPGAPGCLVIVTSRHQLAGLAATDGARLLTLDVLTHDEARQMLTTRLGAGRADDEPDAVTQIAGYAPACPWRWLSPPPAPAPARPCPCRRWRPSCATSRVGWTAWTPATPPPASAPSSPGPPSSSPRTRQGCSACSASTPAPISPPPPRPAWPA